MRITELALGVIMDEMFTPDDIERLDNLLLFGEMSCIVDQEIIDQHGKLMLVDIRPYAKGTGTASVTLSDSVKPFLQNRTQFMVDRFGHLTMSDRACILVGLVVPKDVSYEFQKQDRRTVAEYLRSTIDRPIDRSVTTTP